MLADAISPGIIWILPFVALLLCIAILPLVPKVAKFWERNSSKLIVALGLGLVTAAYITSRDIGFSGSAPGLPALRELLKHGIVHDYIPFIILLFSLYVISGGIRISGDIPAHPVTNALFLAMGGLIASFIGTTGASMLLIRPLLQINSERKYVRHTVVFFIFIVSNIGGVLLPTGDPPLLLGYLRGVPFTWTFKLLPHWAFCFATLIVIYYFWDLAAHKRERPEDVLLDETRIQPVRIEGLYNLFFLAGVVLAVAGLVPDQNFPGTQWVVPNLFLREIVLLILTGVSYFGTSKCIHRDNQFNFHAIGEVACLFIGIFLTMQVPIEILRLKGESLGIITSREFFWWSGMLSSVLDNAPTYVVFFELAGSLQHTAGPVLDHVLTPTGHIGIAQLEAISCGAVFMGANTYIGNGPNFLVKAVADHHGVKMPGFFGYMIYSGCILIPLFILMTFIFFKT